MKNQICIVFLKMGHLIIDVPTYRGSSRADVLFTAMADDKEDVNLAMIRSHLSLERIIRVAAFMFACYTLAKWQGMNRVRRLLVEWGRRRRMN